MGTLWNKGVSATQAVEDFTVGNDRVLDMRLAKYDVIGSKAHIRMLAQIGLLEEEEEKVLQNGLDQILKEIEEGNFRLDDDIEDIHSQVELNLTGKLGEIGKKIHSGRSRNDQVLVDIKLFLREELEKLRDSVVSLFDTLQNLSEKYKDVLLPGYTHTQIAMPSCRIWKFIPSGQRTHHQDSKIRNTQLQFYRCTDEPRKKRKGGSLCNGLSGLYS